MLVIENLAADIDKTRGEVSVSMSDAGGILETPLSFAKGSALFAVRRRYPAILLTYTDLAG